MHGPRSSGPLRFPSSSTICVDLHAARQHRSPADHCFATHPSSAFACTSARKCRSVSISSCVLGMLLWPACAACVCAALKKSVVSSSLARAAVSSARDWVLNALRVLEGWSRWEGRLSRA